MNDKIVRIVKIIPGTSVDGPGLRTSIYFSGCKHHCVGCHNPSTWSLDAGDIISIKEVEKIILENEFNVTFSGGDPFYQIEEAIELAKTVKRAGLNLWIYTGYTFEEIESNNLLNRLLPYCDVLVDGPYIERLGDISLRFRGSSNQRLINVPATLKSSEIILWTD